MDSTDQLFVTFWKLVALVLSVFMIVVAWYNIDNNVHWYKSWDLCVQQGGQPGNQPVLGSDTTHFTCLRK